MEEAKYYLEATTDDEDMLKEDASRVLIKHGPYTGFLFIGFQGDGSEVAIHGASIAEIAEAVIGSDDLSRAAKLAVALEKLKG